ncbi:MAG: GNAT family N-acetyltransferase [Candidatus Eremiobacteraeota bacterium]|nr:GNAT family N-acetyltransferase [Candidatus Eremiobacteraeota bacterium]
MRSRTCSARTGPRTVAGACTGGSAARTTRARTRRTARTFARASSAGRRPGLVAFDGDRAVGWCQLTPRDELPWLDRGHLTRRVDDAPVWVLSCFFIRRGYRKRGVMSALINAAVEAARREHVTALEAYPVDAHAPSATRNLFTGVASAFARAGFRAVALPAPHRPTMRLIL